MLFGPCGLVTSNGSHFHATACSSHLLASKVLFKEGKMYFKYNAIQIQVFKPLYFHLKVLLNSYIDTRICIESKDLWKLNRSSNPPSPWNFLGFWFPPSPPPPPPPPPEFSIPSMVGLGFLEPHSGDCVLILRMEVKTTIFSISLA